MGEPARRSSRIPVVLNHRAGTDDKSGVVPAVAQLFRDRHVDVDLHVLENEADFARIGEVVRGACVAVAGGGDGTVNALACALAGTQTRLGVLPLGTLNHFAHDLGIPANLEKAVDIIVSGGTRCVDVGEVNDRVFVNNSSIGIYPSLVQAREALRQEGHGKWPAFALAAVRVLRRQRRISVRLQAEGQASSWWRTPFVLIGNNEYDVVGLRLVGRSCLDTGHLFTYVAPKVRTLDLPKAIAVEWLERLFHRTPRSPQFRMLSAPEFWIDAAGPRTAHVALDGEVMTTRFPLHYRSRPGALQVLCPAA